MMIKLMLGSGDQVEHEDVRGVSWIPVGKAGQGTVKLYGLDWEDFLGEYPVVDIEFMKGRLGPSVAIEMGGFTQDVREALEVVARALAGMVKFPRLACDEDIGKALRQLKESLVQFDAEAGCMLSDNGE